MSPFVDFKMSNKKYTHTPRNSLTKQGKNEQQIQALVNRVHHRNSSGSGFSRAVTLAAISNCHYMRPGACMSSLFVDVVVLPDKSKYSLQICTHMIHTNLSKWMKSLLLAGLAFPLDVVCLR